MPSRAFSARRRARNSLRLNAASSMSTAAVHEHLLDARQRLQRFRAAGARSRWAPRASRPLRAPRARAALRAPRARSPPAPGRRSETRRPVAKRCASAMPASVRHRAQELLGRFSSRPQPSPVLPSAATAPRWVRRLREVMAVRTSQWLGTIVEACDQPESAAVALVRRVKQTPRGQRWH